jgi:hypothetical protein
MTAASGAPAPLPAPARRPVDVFGIVAVCVAGVALAPALLVFLVGLIPSMNAIWWLGIVLIPLIAIAGVLAAVLGVVGLVIGLRRRSRFVLSIVGIVLGLVLLFPYAYLFLSSSI